MGPYTLPGNTARENEAGVAEAINAFSINLFKQLSAERVNIVLSPCSIETSLAMTAGGAKGATLTEMERVLHFPDSQNTAWKDKIWHIDGGFQQLLAHLHESKGAELNVANTVWGAKSIPWRKEFLERLDEYYDGGFQTADFTDSKKAASRVNSWVERQTKRKIVHLLDESNITADTRMILANAVYFHGKWAKPFEKKNTVVEPFHNGKKNSQARLMCQTAESGYFQGDGYQALELPYRGNDFGMIVLLPKQNEGLPEFEKRFTPELFETVCKNLDRPTKVSVKLPRFQFEKGWNLKPTLQAMGMRQAFEANADFSGMQSGQERLKIDVVQHKAFIDVAEEGTEAAAATVVTMGLAAAAPSMEPPIPNFHADHPFLYAIRHRPSGAILFLGRVEYPG